MLLTVLILVIVVFVRAFESLLQRLFVYLTAITVWYMTVQIMRLKPVYTGSNPDQFCAAMGFLDQWATVCILSFTPVVSLVILCKVCEWDICSCNSQTGRTKKLIEGAFVLFLIVSPLPISGFHFSMETMLDSVTLGVGLHHTTRTVLRILRDSGSKLVYITSHLV